METIMNVNRKGRRAEHDLAAELDDVTTDEVWVTTCGWSGNAEVDACDLVITVDPYLCTSFKDAQYNVEVKTSTGDAGYRSTVFRGSSNDETGIEELERFVAATPRWAQPTLVISFDHRAPLVYDARRFVRIARGEEKDVDGGFHGVRTTDGGNVSMVKPETDDHPSARAIEDDGTYVATKLALPLNGGE